MKAYKPVPCPWTTGLVGNFLILVIPIYATLLEAFSIELYYQSIQEDAHVEWASFWAFLLASVLFAVSAAQRRRATPAPHWFLFGLAFFSLWVALEEISWGQRLLGYRPPAYFLEHNFQQELNLHNVVSTPLRILALMGIILGYGVVLPLGMRLPGVGRRLHRIGVVAPPVVVVPAFLVTFMLYVWSPWFDSGEWVELMLGLGFLFSAWCSARPHTRLALPISASWLVVMGLGFLSAAVSQNLNFADPESIRAADLEVEALKQDFLQELPRCGLHKRIYGYEEKYRQRHLVGGEFSRLTLQGLPEARARFFLDPWNSPYWIRSFCVGRRVSIFVYSLGPNRRRDSTPWEIGGDDVGAYIIRRGF